MLKLVLNVLFLALSHGFIAHRRPSPSVRVPKLSVAILAPEVASTGSSISSYKDIKVATNKGISFHDISAEIQRFIDEVLLFKRYF